MKYLFHNESFSSKKFSVFPVKKNKLKFAAFSAFCHGRNTLASLCSYITGDALLYSMFREESIPVPCPFHGPMTFTYNRGPGRCSSPLSNVDTCTDDSRLLFRYQACPDVPGSESAGLSSLYSTCFVEIRRKKF